MLHNWMSAWEVVMENHCSANYFSVWDQMLFLYHMGSHSGAFMRNHFNVGNKKLLHDALREAILVQRNDKPFLGNHFSAACGKPPWCYGMGNHFNVWGGKPCQCYGMESHKSANVRVEYASANGMLCKRPLKY